MTKLNCRFSSAVHNDAVHREVYIVVIGLSKVTITLIYSKRTPDVQFGQSRVFREK